MVKVVPPYVALQQALLYRLNSRLWHLCSTLSPQWTCLLYIFLLEQVLKTLGMFLKEMVSLRAAAIRIKCFILLLILAVAMRAPVRSRVCRGQKQQEENVNGFGGERKKKKKDRPIHCFPHIHTAFSMKHWHTVKHWLNRNQNRALHIQ